MWHRLSAKRPARGGDANSGGGVLINQAIHNDLCSGCSAMARVDGQVNGPGCAWSGWKTAPTCWSSI